MSDTKAKRPARKSAAKKSGAAAGGRKASTARAKAEGTKTGTTRAKASSKKTSTRRPRATAKTASRAQPKQTQPLEQQFGSLFEGISDLTSSAMKIVSKTRERASKSREQILGNTGRVSAKTPSADQLRKMADAGESLRDLREVAGLTLADITKALKLKDKSVLEAIEGGKEAVSMEMIMRLASLYARNDPIPFVVNYVRTYRPKLWEVLEDWGLDGIPIRMERERQFLNIYRRRDAARQLSKEGFEKVLAFTGEAFELSLHFIAEMEEIENEVNPEFDETEKNKQEKPKKTQE